MADERKGVTLDEAATRLVATIARLDEAVTAQEGERRRLADELAALRAAQSEAERRIGHLEAENAGLKRLQGAVAERLDGTILAVEKLVAGAH